MKHCVAGLIIRSSSATRYLGGLSLQAGLGAFSWMQAAASGRWVAAKSATGGCVLSERGDKCIPRHPDEPVLVWRQLRRLWMRFLPIEDFGDSLAFVGWQGGDIDRRPNPLIGSRAYHRAGIDMRHQDNRAADTLQHAGKRGDVVR